MHFKSCGWKEKEMGRTTEALQKSSRNDFVSKNFVLILNLATFLTSSFLVDQCPFSRKQKKTSFYRVYVFLSWRRTDFVVLTRKNIVAILQSDIRRHKGTFLREPSYRFYPLNFCFLFPISFVFLVYSDLFWVEYRWKRPVCCLFYPTQGLDVVFGDEMLRVREHM